MGNKNGGIGLLVREISERIPHRIEGIKKDFRDNYLSDREWCERKNIDSERPDEDHAFLEYFKEKYTGLITHHFLDRNKGEGTRSVGDFVREKVENLSLNELEEVCEVSDFSLAKVFKGESLDYYAHQSLLRFLDRKVIALYSV